MVDTADSVRHETGDNPAHDHESLPSGNEHASMARGHRLRENSDDNGDAGANAESGNKAKHRKERNVHRESLGQGEQAVENDRQRKHLLSADFVREDTAACAADNHAKQAPRGKRAHRSTRNTKRSRQIRVGGIDNHEVVTVENHCTGEKHENAPRMCIETE